MKQIKTKNNHYLYIDSLRIFASFFVVIIHTIGIEGKLNNPMDDISWWITNIISTIVNSAVPLFFMVSGFTLIKPKISPFDFYKKRLLRILTPLLFWSVIFIFVRVFFEANQISFLSAIRIIWTGPVYYHLWFMYSLIGVYIAMPFVSCFISQENDKLLWLFIIIWFSYYHFIYDSATILKGITNFSFKPQFHMSFFSSNINYAILGYLLGNLKNHNLNKLVKITFIFCVLYISLGNYFIETESKYSILFSYSGSIKVVLYSVIFLLFKNYKYSTGFKSINKLSSLTFGIYLSHPLFVNLTSCYFPYIRSDELIIVDSIIIYIMSAVLVWIMLKIPILRKTV